jgi:hypothetical protein
MLETWAGMHVVLHVLLLLHAAAIKGQLTDCDQLTGQVSQLAKVKRRSAQGRVENITSHERCWSQQAARLLIMERPAPCMQISKPRVIQVLDCLCSPKEVAVTRKHGGEVFSAMNASLRSVYMYDWILVLGRQGPCTHGAVRRYACVCTTTTKGEKGGKPVLSAAILEMHVA